MGLPPSALGRQRVLCVGAGSAGMGVVRMIAAGGLREGRCGRVVLGWGQRWASGIGSGRDAHDSSRWARGRGAGVRTGLLDRARGG